MVISALELVRMLLLWCNILYIRVESCNIEYFHRHGTLQQARHRTQSLIVMMLLSIVRLNIAKSSSQTSPPLRVVERGLEFGSSLAVYIVRLQRECTLQILCIWTPALITWALEFSIVAEKRENKRQGKRKEKRGQSGGVRRLLLVQITIKGVQSTSHMYFSIYTCICNFEKTREGQEAQYLPDDLSTCSKNKLQLLNEDSEGTVLFYIRFRIQWYCYNISQSSPRPCIQRCVQTFTIPYPFTRISTLD